jgi:hypothetical protein
VSARAPRQPSEATSCTHFPAVQICITLSATQNPAPSLKDRPAHAQPLAGTGTSAGKYGGGWSASGGDGAGWARAAESNRALIKIDLASIRIIAPRSPVVDALPSHGTPLDYYSRIPRIRILLISPDPPPSNRNLRSTTREKARKPPVRPWPLTLPLRQINPLAVVSRARGGLCKRTGERAHKISYHSGEPVLSLR